MTESIENTMVTTTKVHGRHRDKDKGGVRFLSSNGLLRS